jgi:UDP-N-acetylenolpyruvoylglucosamine reductase
VNDLTLISVYGGALPAELDAIQEAAVAYAWAYAYVISTRRGASTEQAERIADRVRRNVRRAFRFPLSKEVSHAE